MKIIILLILICLPISVSSQESNPCDCSIKLATLEHGYGPPSSPVEKVDMATFKKEKKNLKSEEDFNALYRLAYMAQCLNRNKDAILYFSKAESLIKDEIPKGLSTAHFFVFYGMAYEEIGNLEKARYYYEKNGDPYYRHLIKARINRKLGDIKKAEHEYLLAQCVELYEMFNYDPFEELSEMYFENQNYELAKKYILKYIDCAKYELKEGGGGYAPVGDSHIKKAIKYLKEIEEKISTTK